MAASASFAYPSDLDSNDGLYGPTETFGNDDDLVLDMDSLSISRGSRPSIASAFGRSSSGRHLCVVCGRFPRKGSYKTCSQACGRRHEQSMSANCSLSGASPSQVSLSGRRRLMLQATSRHGSVINLRHHPVGSRCVICKEPTPSPDLLTCDISCLEKLCKNGGDPTMCDYCHQNPRAQGQTQCSNCVSKAKVACLVCRCRSKNGRYHFCGRTCHRLAQKLAPFVLEVPRGHVTFELEGKYKGSWQDPTKAMPPITRVFKVVEKEDILTPYNDYRNKFKSTETFRYHGTKRECQLGATPNSNNLCASLTCSICNILRSSFKKSKADPKSAFGAAIYTSSNSNKSHMFCGTNGVMLLTKVVLGNIKQVSNYGEVTSCPQGCNSVVFDLVKGNRYLNETIVYDDDAIRPVFLITF